MHSLVLAAAFLAAAPDEPGFVARMRAELLCELARPKPQVELDVAILSVPDDFPERSGLVPKPLLPSGAWTTSALTPRERDLFRAAARNCPDVKHLAEPRVLVTDGAEARFHTGGTARYVTGFDVSLKGQDVLIVPRTVDVEYGITTRVTARVAPDGKSVHVEAGADYSAPTRPAKKVPITLQTGGTPLTKELDELQPTTGGGAGASSPVPEGGTMVFGGIAILSHTTEGQPEPKPRSFLILVTPRVVKPLVEQARGSR